MRKIPGKQHHPNAKAPRLSQRISEGSRGNENRFLPRDKSISPSSQIRQKSLLDENMLFSGCSIKRGCIVEARTSTTMTTTMTTTTTKAGSASTRAGPGSVRRHRPGRKTLLAILLTVCIKPIVAFRGPHHPRSSVSHHHYVPVQSIKLTQDEELLHDAAHLTEDMGSLAEQIDVSKMNPQELEFYYFKVHDIDNNTKLDGLELLHALQHTLHSDEAENDVDHGNDVNHEHVEERKEASLDYSWIIELIDRVLEEDDLDNDGYLGYIEYVLGRQKDQDEKARRDINLKI